MPIVRLVFYMKMCFEENNNDGQLDPAKSDLEEQSNSLAGVIKR